MVFAADGTLSSGKLYLHRCVSAERLTGPRCVQDPQARVDEKQIFRQRRPQPSRRAYDAFFQPGKSVLKAEPVSGCSIFPRSCRALGNKSLAESNANCSNLEDRERPARRGMREQGQKEAWNKNEKWRWLWLTQGVREAAERRQ